MRRRASTVSLLGMLTLVLTMLLAACGGDGLMGSGASPIRGTWSGQTDPDRSLTLTMNEEGGVVTGSGSMRIMSSNFAAKVTSGTLKSDTVEMTVFLPDLRGGCLSFSPCPPGISLTFKGTLQNKQITGALITERYEVLPLTLRKQ
jgi:hypothetical protein